MAPGRPKKFCETDVLGRAMEVFWDHGYEATSMAQLVEAMGIGRQSLYDTFGDKRQLFITALKQYAESNANSVIELLEGAEPPLERIRSLLSRWEQHNTSCNRGCLLAGTMNELGTSDADVTTLQLSLIDQLSEKLAEVLEQARAAGDLPDSADPVSLSRTLVTLVHGFSLMGKGGADPAYIHDSIRTVHRLLNLPELTPTQT